jgi:hypothetical protein
MSETSIKFLSPRESTVHNQLLKFFLEREFKRKLPDYDIPTLAVREIFRIWALCFRDVPCVDADERISSARFLEAADFSVVQWQHQYMKRYISVGRIDKDRIHRANAVLWYWMIVVAQRLFSARYKGFLDDVREKLVSQEFCVNLTTWDSEWISRVE